MGLSQISLAALARSAIERAQARADQNKVVFVDDIAAETTPLVADYRRLEQVIDELLENAVKFSPNGGEVQVTVREGGDVVYLKVSDQGIGIPAEQLPRIWDRFYQSDASTTRRFGGTGVGLAVVKQIVEAGNRLGRKSERAGQSILRGVAAHAAGGGRTGTCLKTAYSSSTTIQTRSNFCALCLRCAAVNSQARTLAQKVCAWRVSAASDLILVDVMMPDIDGYEVCRRLRADPLTATIPIVILTARSSLVDQTLGLEAGADRFLIKPVGISILTGLADTLIAEHRQTEGNSA